MGSYQDEISYITIQTLGNASDFGDLITAREQPAACSDLVRGVFYGGSTSGDIDYITIATTGNATDFGTNATEGAAKGHAGVSNNVRGVFTGHIDETDIDYITIQTTGTVTNFGDQAVLHDYVGGVQGGGRGIFGGGNDSSNNRTNISGFNALPGGCRDYKGIYEFEGTGAYWWSTSISTPFIDSWFCFIDDGSNDLLRFYFFNTFGYSVRCIRD